MRSKIAVTSTTCGATTGQSQCYRTEIGDPRAQSPLEEQRFGASSRESPCVGGAHSRGSSAKVSGNLLPNIVPVDERSSSTDANLGVDANEMIVYDIVRTGTWRISPQMHSG